MERSCSLENHVESDCKTKVTFRYIVVMATSGFFPVTSTSQLLEADLEDKGFTHKRSALFLLNQLKLQFFSLVLNQVVLINNAIAGPGRFWYMRMQSSWSVYCTVLLHVAVLMLFSWGISAVWRHEHYTSGCWRCNLNSVIAIKRTADALKAYKNYIFLHTNAKCWLPCIKIPYSFSE